MKQFISFLFFLFSISLFAQDPFVIHQIDSEGGLTIKEVNHMAVYPGCQQFNSVNKSSQIKCLSTNLNQSLGKYLENFVETFESYGFISAQAKVRFVIGTNGKIRDIEAVTDSLKVQSVGDIWLGEEAVKAMEKTAKIIKPIAPAKLTDGKSVNLQFDLPVSFYHENTKVDGIKMDEMVVLTLFDQAKKYEFREPKNAQNKIIVYEVVGVKEKLIKSFANLNEAVKSPEYYPLFANTEKKELMAEKYINGTKYRMYNSTNKPGWVDVYQFNDGKEKLRESFDFTKVIYSDLYLKIIFR
jgi:hypothetical protein